MRKELLKRRVHTDWSWILMIAFFILSVVNVYFGFFGLICMAKPMYHAFKGRGKIHCSHYCPRGAILGRGLKNFSFNNNLPDWMRKKNFKNTIIILMVFMFGLSLIKAGGDLEKTAFAVTRLMIASTVVAVIMGIFFKPRAWCQVCPMGTGTGYISKMVDRKIYK